MNVRCCCDGQRGVAGSDVEKFGGSEVEATVCRRG